MKTTRRSFLRVLSAAVIALAGVTAVHAQTVNPVPEPTIITTAPYEITTAGYYQLGANLNYAGNGATNDAIITISASNVTLDFAGHFIAGPTTNPATLLNGVYANERANVIIQNGTIAYCRYGINLVGNNSQATNFLNARVLNMTVTKCYSTGIGMLYAVANEVIGCRVSSIGGLTTAQNADTVGIANDGNRGGKVANCTVSTILKKGTGTAYGIYNPGFAKDNVVYNATTGIIYGKYQDNLFVSVTTPFTGGTDAGGNN